MFMPNDLYVPIGSEIAFKCDDGLVFSHDINNDPIVYTICEPNGTVVRHGKIDFWRYRLVKKNNHHDVRDVLHGVVHDSRCSHEPGED